MKINIKKYAILILIIMLIPLSGCSINGYKDNDKSVENIDSLSEKQWVEDVDYLYKELPKKHKNLYHSLKEEAFKSEIGQLKKDIHKLKDYEIKCRIAQVVALVGDAHTSVNLDFGEAGECYPIKLKWFGEELRIITIEKNKKDILGMKVKSINGIPIDDVMKKVNTLISHENNQWLKAKNVYGISSSQILKALGIVVGGDLEVSFDDEISNVKKVVLEPLKYKKINIDNFATIADQVADKPIGLINNDKAYWYKYIPEDRILYLQYNECIDYESAKMFGYKHYESYPKFDEFSNEFLNELKNKEVDKLIVDLRNNLGGVSNLMESLARAVNRIDKLKGEGEVLVLIGKSTFSSGVIAAVDIKNFFNATLIGEPTGGNPNGYGDVSTFQLPNSKVDIVYPTNYVKCTYRYDENIIPDMQVDETFEKYNKGIDEVYEVAKNYDIKK